MAMSPEATDKPRPCAGIRTQATHKLRHCHRLIIQCTVESERFCAEYAGAYIKWAYASENRAR